MVFLSQKEIDAKADQRLQSVKALYSEFSRLLDCNYAAGDAISGVQYGRGNKPITGHVTSVIENTRGMLDSYRRIIEQSGPMVSGERLELKELDGRIEAIGEAALGYARVHDSLLKSGPEEIGYCIPKIKQSVESTSEEMCYPEKPEFRAKNVRSLQDAMRYMHEKAADAVFVLNDVKQTDNGIGGRSIYDDLWRYAEVLDIGGGISDSAAGKKEPLCKEDILSEPLKAVWGEKVCGNRGNMKVFAASDFMNAQIKLGKFHYATVEAVIRKKEFERGGKNYAHNNYIRLRYIERSGFEGMEYRLAYVSKAMESLGFKVQTNDHCDAIKAEFKGHYPDITENALKELFRLLSSCDAGTEYIMTDAAEHIAKNKNMPVDAAANEMIDAAVNNFKDGNSSLDQFLETLKGSKLCIGGKA